MEITRTFELRVVSHHGEALAVPEPVFWWMPAIHVVPFCWEGRAHLESTTLATIMEADRRGLDD